MTQLLPLPWLELAVAIAIVGSVVVSRIREPYHAWQLYIFVSGTVFVCASFAWLCFYLYGDRAGESPSVQPWLFGRTVFAPDELTAPLLPLLSLIYFLTGMVTSRSRMQRNAFAGSLAAEALRLLTFSTVVSPDFPGSGWILIGLLAANTIPPYFDLVSHGKSARVFLIHMGLFVALLVVGWALVEYSRAEAGDSGPLPWWAVLPLLVAVLLRCGIFPMHAWVVDLFENAGFGHALLFVLPLSGVLIAIRLIIPIAPDWSAHH